MDRVRADGAAARGFLRGPGVEAASFVGLAWRAGRRVVDPDPGGDLEEDRRDGDDAHALGRQRRDPGGSSPQCR